MWKTGCHIVLLSKTRHELISKINFPDLTSFFSACFIVLRAGRCSGVCAHIAACVCVSGPHTERPSLCHVGGSLPNQGSLHEVRGLRGEEKGSELRLDPADPSPSPGTETEASPSLPRKMRENARLIYRKTHFFELLRCEFVRQVNRRGKAITGNDPRTDSREEGTAATENR